MQDQQTPSTAPRQNYARRLEARRVALAVREGRQRILGSFRVLVFFTCVAMTFAAVIGHMFSPWWLLVPAGSFCWLGRRLQRAEAERIRFSRAVAYYERALARLDRNRAGSGETGERFSTITLATCTQATSISSAKDRCLNCFAVLALPWDRKCWRSGS